MCSVFCVLEIKSQLLNESVRLAYIITAEKVFELSVVLVSGKLVAYINTVIGITYVSTRHGESGKERG